MLCTNGHNCSDAAKYCSTCGINTFQPGTATSLQITTASSRTNGFAIASLVLGIVWIYWIGSILALVFGYMARSQIRDSREGGSGMAVAGIILGWIGIAVMVGWILLGILFVSQVTKFHSCNFFGGVSHCN